MVCIKLEGFFPFGLSTHLTLYALYLNSEGERISL